MTKLTSFLLITLALAISASAQSDNVSPNDLKPLEGTTWKGTLTYVDYGSGKRTSIKSELVASKINDTSWKFEFNYPDEPKANSKKTVELKEGGKLFNGETVVEKTQMTDGTLKLVTTSTGTDNNKPATYTFTYLLSKTSFSTRKDVKVEGSTESFERNTYAWTR